MTDTEPQSHGMAVSDVMPDLEIVRSRACQAFVAPKARFYVNIPASLRYDKFLFHTDSRQGPLKPVDPLAFFTADGSEPSTAWGGSFITGDPPFAAIVTGQFGVGKTELARQVTSEMEANAFPLELSKCDGRVFNDSALNAEQMLRVLCQPHIRDQKKLNSATIRELLDAIHEGRILLILDGLDELIFTVEGHENFFQSLSNLLRTETSPCHCRVVVTIRTEYLQKFDRHDAHELVKRLNSQASLPKLSIPFLRMDYFTKVHLETYLARELGTANANRIEGYPALRELLRRPLMTRLFCDYVGKGGMNDEDFDDLSAGNELVERYIEAYIQFADDDTELRRAQATISGDIQWDLDAIAARALELYKVSRDYFSRQEIAACTKAPLPPGVDPFGAICKCPFVIRDGEKDTLRFTHQTFFEYFVARGLALNARLSNPAPPQHSFDEFDDLIVNVDIRKFLRNMLGDTWRDRTRYSYALDGSQWTQWKAEFGLTQPNDRNIKELEGIRLVLMDLMTEPENFRADRRGKEAVETIRKFLNHQLQQLHPRYLMYNLEAVSVYVRTFGWEPEAVKINEQLSAAMHALCKRRVPRNLANRSEGSEDLIAGYELLVIRLLRIAKQMRYQWFNDFKKWRTPKTWERDIGSVRPDSAQMLSHVFDD